MGLVPGNASVMKPSQICSKHPPQEALALCFLMAITPIRLDHKDFLVLAGVLVDAKDTAAVSAQALITVDLPKNLPDII